MSKLYGIIKELKNTQGNNDKLAILEANKDNEELRAYLKAVYDPSINYYMKKPVLSDRGNIVTNDWSTQILEELQSTLCERKLTGNSAKEWLAFFSSNLNHDARELLSLVFDRSIGASIGETMVLKIWPELFFVPPYMRCSLLDEKIKGKFEKEDSFYVQTKMDGSFCYIETDHNGDTRAITRNGSVYPKWFSDRFVNKEMALFNKAFKPNVNEGVLVGELLVFEGDTLLDRKKGNGILNSILHGEEENNTLYNFCLYAWDYLSILSFKNGFCHREYQERFVKLCKVIEDSDIDTVRLVDHFEVADYTKAFQIYTRHLAENKEGVILKTKTSTWANNTSKEWVKLKIKFQADYVITGTYEGTGKAAGMLGGLSVESSDGILKTNVGSGFDDATRKKLWSIKDSLLGRIVTVESNGVVSKEKTNTKSLFLPVFVEIRYDKNDGDTLEQINEQYEASKR
jgi:ATP-dependent DNA ligase